MPNPKAPRSEHTPGPWLAKKGAGWFVTRPDAEKRREAALAVGMRVETSLVGSPERDDGPECEANARLMAASPDLLASLRNSAAAMEYMLAFLPRGEVLAEKCRKTLEAARGAIAKATAP